MYKDKNKPTQQIKIRNDRYFDLWVNESAKQKNSKATKGMMKVEK